MEQRFDSCCFGYVPKEDQLLIFLSLFRDFPIRVAISENPNQA